MKSEEQFAPDWQKERRNLITGFIQPVSTKKLSWEQRKERAQLNRRNNEE